MRIGLVDIDSHNFPNLPLMKLSAWHKRQGDRVEWYLPAVHGFPAPPMDKVYLSKTFRFTPDYWEFINAKEIIKGGSGYCIELANGRENYHKEKDIPLPYGIEHICPDYSLYPELTKDTAYGFLSRGCPRGCAFCHVGAKEGREAYKVADLSEFWHGQKNITLLDPNITACRDWKNLLQQLIDSKAWVDFSQGVDIRLMTEEKAEMIRRIKAKNIHFAWDRYGDKESVLPKLRMFKELTGWDKRKLTVYVLTNFDTTAEQDLERIYTLRELGYRPYVMIYDKAHTQASDTVRKIQRWVNMRAEFESYKISEWEVNANRSYKAIHNPDDNADYSKKFEKFKWLARVLYEYGISADGKTRLTLERIRSRGEKWCRQTYNEFRANRNIGSVTNAHALDLKITDTDRYCYIVTYSFPCQDLSVAGRQKGMGKGSGTRSGLLWEVERLLQECGALPQVLLMENVPQVHSKANMLDFQKWIDFLEGKGYSNYWQDLNSIDYGVAQNRGRCFMVSVLGKWNYKFPQPMPLEKKLKDYLEDEVDEKYYINNEKAQKLIQTLIENGTLKDGVIYPNDTDFEMDGNFNQRGKVHGEGSVCRTILGEAHGGNEQKIIVDLSLKEPKKKAVANCILARDYSVSNVKTVGNGVLEIKSKGVKQVGNMDEDRKNFKNPQCGRVYSGDGVSPTLNTCQGGQREVKIIVSMRGRNPDNPSDRRAGSPTEQRLEPNSKGVCNTLTGAQKDNIVLENVVDLYNQRLRKDECYGAITANGNTSSTHCGSFGVIEKCRQYRIRKLTPLEYWRLMGFSDEDFRKAEAVNSNSQLYKQAGNSIVKDVLIAVFGQMLFQKRGGRR